MCLALADMTIVRNDASTGLFRTKKRGETSVTSHCGFKSHKKHYKHS